MAGPLTGYRIIEIAGIGPGPFAAMLLADMGAEVVRVERVLIYKACAVVVQVHTWHAVAVVERRLRELDGHAADGVTRAVGGDGRKCPLDGARAGRGLCATVRRGHEHRSVRR